MINVLDHVPYEVKTLGKRKVAENEHLLIMQIALRPGQAVPRHDANSHAHLLILQGELSVELSGSITAARTGDLIPVEYKTPMAIENRSNSDATFLVIKSPHPDKIGQ